MIARKTIWWRVRLHPRLHVPAARGREQLAIGLLFALGLLLGLAVAPVIADYADADPSASGATGP